MEKDLEGRTPPEERADIGTPAGESPEEGRKRHGTKQEGEQAIQVEPIFPEEDEELDEMVLEDLSETGGEVSTTGGITGTHKSAAKPAGGNQSGGTPVPPEGQHSRDYKS